MGENPSDTINEIEETREDLARKVDELVGRAKVEAVAVSKKLMIGVVALAGLVVIGTIAKKRVGS